MLKIAKSAKIWHPVAFVEEGHHISIGKRCRIGQFCFIGARKLIMEEGAELCPHVTIGGGGDVYIGKNACVSYGAKIIPATFMSEGDFMNDAVLERNPDQTVVLRGSISIGKGAYVGSNSIICVSKKRPHVFIHDFAIIGALAYVDFDVPRNTVVIPTPHYHSPSYVPNSDAISPPSTAQMQALEKSDRYRMELRKRR